MSEWESDPVVLLEKAISPASWIGLNILCRLTPSSATMDFGDDFRMIKAAEELLRSGGRKHLEKAGVTISGSDLRQCETTADMLRKLLRSLDDIPGLRDDPDRRRAIADTIRLDIQPAIEASLDVFRSAFIGMMLQMQRAQAKQASDAIANLEQISKQIYFIAINAAVEAARVGEYGVGFMQISADIRSLSKDAQSATLKLSSLNRT